MDNNQNNNGSDNKISVPPVFNGEESSKEPTQIESPVEHKDIVVNNSQNISSNNIFKIPIETKPNPSLDNKASAETTEPQTPEVEQTPTNNYQSTNNNATLDKDNPVPQMNNTEIDDNELLEAFIVKNHKRFGIPFNFFAFLFGNLYFFYRKLFILGILVFLIEFVLLNFVTIKAASLLFRFILGIAFNFIYLGIAKHKISKIKYIKSQESKEDLKKICASKGGTSGLLLLLGIVLEIVAGVIAVLFLGFSAFFSGVSSVIENADDGSVIIYDSSVNIKDEFSIKVPSRFEDSSDESSYKYTYFGDKGLFNKCEFMFSAVNNYKDPKVLIEKWAGSFEKEYNGETIKTNNLEWYTVDRDLLGKVYYYATKKNNKVYLLEYTVQEDADDNCDYYRSLILN